jgi:predicted dienelactone hydrolase
MSSFHSITHKVQRGIFFLGALFALAASAGAVVVGTQTLDYKDDSRSRAVVSELWFPAAAGAKAADFSAVPPISAVPLALGAQPAAEVKNRPLIIISHGNWSTRYGHAWLARELVSAGYVVLSVSHPGTMNGDMTLSGRVRLWDRAQDVSFALGQLLADERYKTLVDTGRIGFVGHSFGGFAGVVLAGGRWSYEAQRKACQDMVKTDLYCSNAPKDDITGISFQGMQANLADNRIKSFYIMGSGPAAGFAPESLAQISKPFLIDTAKYDDVLEPMSNSTALAKQIPNAKEIVRNMGHFSYAPICKPVIGKLLAAQICTDPPGVERAQVHGMVSKDAIEFFKKSL